MNVTLSSCSLAGIGSPSACIALVRLSTAATLHHHRCRCVNGPRGKGQHALTDVQELRHVPRQVIFVDTVSNLVLQALHSRLKNTSCGLLPPLTSNWRSDLLGCVSNRILRRLFNLNAFVCHESVRPKPLTSGGGGSWRHICVHEISKSSGD